MEWTIIYAALGTAVVVAFPRLTTVAALLSMYAFWFVLLAFTMWDKSGELEPQFTGALAAQCLGGVVFLGIVFACVVHIRQRAIAAALKDAAAMADVRERSSTGSGPA
jgi:hypothetical protein